MDGPHEVTSQEFVRFYDIINSGLSGKQIKIVGFVDSDSDFTGDALALSSPP